MGAPADRDAVRIIGALGGSRSCVQPAWMKAADYRAHPRGPLRRAFFRGRYAAQAGRHLGENPYRDVRTTVKARRGSWSEAYSAAWVVGWHDVRDQVPAETAVAVDDEGERAVT